MNLSVQHLSDEAVTAFADGMLGVGPRNRASRHIDMCPECARAVAEQRAAVCALRAAPAPALPVGLLERLRAVPVTTPLNSPPPMGLAPDGSAVFPAYGTSLPPWPPAAPYPDAGRVEFRLPVAVPAVAPVVHAGVDAGSAAVSRASAHPPVWMPRRMGRRTQQLALVAAAAAMLTMGVAASAGASSEARLPSFRPAGGGSVQPALYPGSRKQPAVLVGAVTGDSNH